MWWPPLFASIDVVGHYKTIAFEKQWHDSLLFKVLVLSRQINYYVLLCRMTRANQF